MKLNIQDITLPVQILIDEALTPNTYVYLYYIYNKQIDNAYLISGLSRTQIEDLVYDKYIEVIDEYRKSTLTDGRVVNLGEPEVVLLQRAKNLFEEQEVDTKFNEFWELYPSKVPDGAGGIRILHAENNGSNDYRICKQKYLKIIKNKPGLHDKIIQALKTQLKVTKNRLQYMNGAEVYINQRIWEKYLNLETQEQEKIKGV
jgi:hypothetical protein